MAATAPMLPVPRRSSGDTGIQPYKSLIGMPGQLQEEPASAVSTMMQLLQSQAADRSSMEARGQDLRVAQRLEKVLDPRIPKQARQVLFRELSQQLGVDPKGESSKQFGNLVTSLDPQSLEGLRRQMTAQVSNAKPGQVTELARGLISGQVSAETLVPAFRSAAPAGGDATGGGSVDAGRLTGSNIVTGSLPDTPAPEMERDEPPGMMRLGGPVQAAAERTRQQQRPLPAGDVTTVPGGPGATVPDTRPPPPTQLPAGVEEAETPPIRPEAQIAPPMRETARELTAILGLDDQRYRNRDVQQEFPRIPTSSEDQRKMAGEIRTTQTGVVNTITLSSQLLELIRAGGGDALDFSLALPFMGRAVSINANNVADQIAAFGRATGRTLGIPISDVDVEYMRRVADGRETTPLMSDAESAIRRHLAATGVNVSDSAEINARIRGILVPLAFQMAATKGQSGRFLSDRDVELMFEEIGRSASPRQFEAAIRDMVQRTYNNYTADMRVRTGGRVPLENVIDDNSAAIIGRTDIAPRELYDALGITPTPGRARLRGPQNELPAGDQAPAQPERQGRAPGLLQGPLSMMDLLGRITGGDDRSVLERAGPASGRPQPRSLDVLDPRNPYRGGVEGKVGTGRSQRRARQEEVLPTGPQTPTRQPPRSLERRGRTLEQEEERGRRRAEEDRAEVQRERVRAQRRLELDEAKEGRESRAEIRTIEELRRKRIQEVFNALAGAFRGRSMPSLNLISSPSGDQDANAFRVLVGKDRRPPTPIDAYRFQPRRG